jgi:small-conductance mechanosensitive channel
MVFPYLPGSGSEGFRGVSAFVGLMVSFGAAPAIANLIAGIIITYMRPFKTNDRVKIADATGDILGKDLLVVRMRTIKNVDITIPNALVLANHIINFSSSAKSHGLILNTTITIGYDAPWKRVHALLIEAAKRLEGILPTPEPFVLQTTLDDSYVAYEINAYTDRPNEMASLYSRLNESIQDVFNEAGVEILSPKFAAVRDGNAMAVPESYLPKDYHVPGFTILSRILRSSRPE